MAVRELFSLATAFVILAGVVVAIAPGNQTTAILDHTAGGFGNVIRAATGRANA
jgi:hypothetical protein